MSDYFCVFKKSGVLLYEKGISPEYRDTLIESLNIQKKYQKRTIQDKYMFCNINRDTVYLAILTHRNEEMSKKMIKEYHRLLASDNDDVTENEESSDKVEVKNESIKEDAIEIDKKESDKRTTIKTDSTNLEINGKKITKKNAIKRNQQNSAKANEKTQKERKWDDFEEDPTLDFSSQKSYEIVRNETKKNEVKKNYRFNLFSKHITKEELGEKMETHLINKNLSVEVTKQIINNVLDEMPDTIKESEFKTKLKEIMAKMIKSINHDSLIGDIKSKRGIYVFCFVGVNGVGKSTTLAKMCCWLLKHKLKVYIAACDTFRAGAVEQLKVHVDAFQKSGHNVGFYEKGYNKDDANVAKNAIKIAESEGYDVILIDTAGRMHNKKNLMESLSKLIRVNTIDHIIFVGEALVGNDSLEHLKEFNKAIMFGDSEKCIDSIFVSKVDTVDDKIGQVVNMSVSGECPILFLGTGQTNASLTVLKTEYVVDLLMN
ncbi:hypothetical protein BDAP_001076 [Binucleata daphniae]